MNVLFICTDQQRWNSLGCTGNPCALTPQLDALAAQGCLLERCIVANTVCMPSRASILTGRLPAAHGVWQNGVPLLRREYPPPHQEPGLPPTDLPTLADVFAAAGHATAAFGKLHLTPTRSDPALGHPETAHAWADGQRDDWRGPYFGFQHVDLTISHGDQVATLGAGHYARWLEREHPALLEKVRRRQAEGPYPIPQLKANCYPSALTVDTHHTSWVADRCIRWLERLPPGKDFCAWVGFPDPHHPFTPPEELWQEFLHRPCVDPGDPEQRLLACTPGLAQHDNNLRGVGIEQRRILVRMTDAMNHLIDRAVGRILDALRRSDRWDDTVIVFTSDHGELLGDHGLLHKNGIGCRALLQVPGIIRDPLGRLPKRRAAACSGVDWLPTLCDLAGVPAPAHLDGCSLRSADHTGLAVSLCANNDDPADANHSIFDDRFRLTWYPRTGGRLLLFDHAADPVETVDLAPRHERTVIELHRHLCAAVAAAWSPGQARVSMW